MTSTGELRCKGRRHRLVLFPKYSPHRHFYPLKHWNIETWVCPSPCKCPVFVCARVKCRRRDVKLTWTRRFFVGQMQFKDCMKKNIESPSYRGIIIWYYFFKSCCSRRAGHPAILTCRKCFGLLKGLLVGLNSLYLHLHILLLPSDFFLIFFRSNQSLLLRLLEHIQNIFLQSCTTGQNECDANMSSTL